MYSFNNNQNKCEKYFTQFCLLINNLFFLFVSKKYYVHLDHKICLVFSTGFCLGFRSNNIFQSRSPKTHYWNTLMKHYFMNVYISTFHHDIQYFLTDHKFYIPNCITVFNMSSTILFKQYCTIIIIKDFRLRIKNPYNYV